MFLLGFFASFFFPLQTISVSCLSYVPVLILLLPFALLRSKSPSTILGVSALVGGSGVVLELLRILNKHIYQGLANPVYC